MLILTDATALRTAVQSFAIAYGAGLPAPALAALLAATSAISPVVTICDTAELLFAYQDGITDTAAKAAAQTLCGQCATYAAMNGWHGMADGGRGSGMAQAMQRDLGESPPAGMAWPLAEADPAIDGRFVPAAPVILTPPPS
jgi:hypothetical protein